MNKILIIYYSKTGHTAQIAKELATLCDADIEAIVGTHNGDKGFKFINALFKTGCQSGSVIEPSIKLPEDYDLVVVGTPVWMFKLSSFTRAYLKRHAKQFKQVAFFCTEGGRGAEKVFKQMSDEIQKPAIATLVVNEVELKEQSYQPKLTTFANTLMEKST
jgi:flavodoxin